MKNEKNESHKEKFIALPYMFFGIISFLIICVVGLVLINILIPKQQSGQELIYILIFGNLLYALFPVVLLIVLSKDFFSIVIIDERGVHKALFNKYYKQYISWDELNSMMLMKDFKLHLYFSKIDINKLDYFDLKNNKDVITMTSRADVIYAIRLYTDIGIYNYGFNKHIK